MWKSIIIKAILAIAIIGGGIMVIIKDDPAVPTGDINSIQPLPEQNDP
ncbi:hypothetical protein [Marinobacter metalliresistant]|uniref:Uncharacterized protein n=1 Tax=Marinobacter metalliresistant TaxID=2961995 RepID=A0ABZ2W324_9GAMM